MAKSNLMVESGHLQHILPLAYRNTARPGFAVEVLRLSTILARMPPSVMAGSQRPGFHQVVLFLEGASTHTVDFGRFPCRPGTLLHVKPGQVQRWHVTPGLEAVVLVFTAEFLFPDRPRTGALWHERFFDDVAWPAVLQFQGADLAAAKDWFERLETLYRELEPSQSSTALLRHLVSAVLLDLARRGGLDESAREAPSQELERARRFKRDVERSFRVTRTIRDYARHLGCTPKTLDRSCQDAYGMSAKRFVSDRVALEARRLFGHTAMTVREISEELGFSEPTNFVKFFKSQTGVLPGEFRARSRR